MAGLKSCTALSALLAATWFVSSVLFVACAPWSLLHADDRPSPAPNAISLLSYENRRTEYQHFSTTGFPAGFWPQDARSVFKYPDGSLGYVQHTLVNGPWNTANIRDAIPGAILLLKQVGGVWKDNRSIIDTVNSVPGCIHPRKAVAADFNRDGVMDFAFACHGWDAPPFPGERGRVLLSQPNGTYRLNYLSDDIDFKHGAASVDINGDGYPDLIVTAMQGVGVFINDGSGYFVRSTTHTIPQIRRAFHLELVDVNNDGKADLLVGSHEWEESTKIILNRGDNNFGGSLFNRPAEIIIPPVPGAGVIVDFLYVKSANSLYVLRTGDGKSNGTTFYAGMWLQKFDLTTRVSKVVYADPNWFHNNRKWHTWIVTKEGFIMSDFGQSIMVAIE